MMTLHVSSEISVTSSGTGLSIGDAAQREFKSQGEKPRGEAMVSTGNPGKFKMA
jgi:hypothetical protein